MIFEARNNFSFFSMLSALYKIYEKSVSQYNNFSWVVTKLIRKTVFCVNVRTSDVELLTLRVD